MKTPQTSEVQIIFVTLLLEQMLVYACIVFRVKKKQKLCSKIRVYTHIW